MDHCLHIPRIFLQQSRQLQSRLVCNQNNGDWWDFPFGGDKFLREAVAVVKIDEDNGERCWDALHHGHEESEAVFVGQFVESVVREGSLVQGQGSALERTYGGLVERAPAKVKKVSLASILHLQSCGVMYVMLTHSYTVM